MLSAATSTALVLAQHSHGGSDGNGATVMTIFLVGVLVLIWTLLGVVCWIFWRAKKRDDAAKASTPDPEAPWRNAPSS